MKFYRFVSSSPHGMLGANGSFVFSLPMRCNLSVAFNFPRDTSSPIYINQHNASSCFEAQKLEKQIALSVLSLLQWRQSIPTRKFINYESRLGFQLQALHFTEWSTRCSWRCASDSVEKFYFYASTNVEHKTPINCNAMPPHGFELLAACDAS